jgi:hypothetical protein
MRVMTEPVLVERYVRRYYIAYLIGKIQNIKQRAYEYRDLINCFELLKVFCGQGTDDDTNSLMKE